MGELIYNVRLKRGSLRDRGAYQKRGVDRDFILYTRIDKRFCSRYKMNFDNIYITERSGFKQCMANNGQVVK